MTILVSLAILAGLGLLAVFVMSVVITLFVWVFVVLACATLRRESPDWREFL